MEGRVYRVAGLVALVTLAAAPAAAQRRVPDFASPFLPPDHWAIGAAGRLHALGLVAHGFDRARRPLTRREVGRIFEAAARRAERDRPALLPLVRAYGARYAEEFPATMAALAGADSAGARLGDGSITAGYEVHSGKLLPGLGYENGQDWTGPVRLEDVSTATGAVDGSAELFPILAVGVAPVRAAGDWSFDGGYATGVWRDAGFWIGRRTFGFVPGVGGGIVVNPTVAFDGVGFFLADAVLLPGFLDALGPFLFETFLSRGEQDGPIERPWIWGMRATIEPHARFGLGLTRMAMFGGEGKNGLNLKNLAFLMVGKHAGAGSGFDNQIFSLDAWFRPPFRALPAVAYIEWGLEDSAGAWFDVPGIVLGFEIPALPGAPGVAVGVERASFGRRCCGNPIWYRHWQFLGGWTNDGVALGHPLGGHGSEWRTWTRADVLEARLRLESAVFFRDRGDENLFAPDREGSSTGAVVSAAFRAAPFIDIVLRAGAESGARDWTEAGAVLGLRMLF
ncbi:MAG TPA: capsule assembly Wzi family protein [Longimicrobiales bacterium]